MAKIRKATDTEKKSYVGLYRLYGFTSCDGRVCPVEDLRGAPAGDPQFEVMAPEGMHFCECFETDDCDGNLHSLLCVDLSDVRLRVECFSLHPCRAEVA